MSMRSVVKEIHGWGRYPRANAELVRPERVREIVSPSERPVIARGQGRSYGDAAMSEHGLVMLTERINRLLKFDDSSGVLQAEAGTTIAELIDVILARGFFLPVTPGTKFVSLGGCFAADVHGKNHHRDGTFAEHVSAIELVTANGERRRCSPSYNSELFWATAGGMGLTGVILEISLRLLPVESSFIVARNRPARDLDALLELIDDRGNDDKYSVAWLDALSRGKNLGRGVLTTGHHAKAAKLRGDGTAFTAHSRSKVHVPFDFPSWFLNRASIAAFNELYFRQGKNSKEFLTEFDGFFYTLDRIGDWNRLYGSRGFAQYQCVLPTATARIGLRRLLDLLVASSDASFLAVLKKFGEENKGPLSFPSEGYTLALDLPLSPNLFALLNSFDEIVMENGGRVYLAKDARLSAETLRQMYPRLEEWLEIKRQVDPDDRFQSDLSRRLQLRSRA